MSASITFKISLFGCSFLVLIIISQKSSNCFPKLSNLEHEDKLEPEMPSFLFVGTKILTSLFSESAHRYGITTPGSTASDGCNKIGLHVPTKFNIIFTKNVM